MHYSEAASLRHIRSSKKTELSFWQLGWNVSGRVVNDNSITSYGIYDKMTDQFLYSKKQRVVASKDFVSDLQKLSSQDGAYMACESEVLDWPIYVIEGNWQRTYFTFFANIDMCASDNLKILQKYSVYQEILEEMKKK